jgi:transposase
MPRRVELDQEELERLYVYEGLNKSEIAEEMGVHRGTVRSRINEYGIERPYDDNEELRRLYVEEGRSSVEIGDMFGVNHTTILNRLEEFDIESRTANQDKPPCLFEKEDGYECWVHDDGENQRYVYVHRLLAVAEYGLDAVREREIHHETRIPWDNRPDSIVLLSDEEHGRLHGYESV